MCAGPDVTIFKLERYCSLLSKTLTLWGLAKTDIYLEWGTFGNILKSLEKLKKNVSLDMYDDNVG